MNAIYTLIILSCLFLFILLIISIIRLKKNGVSYTTPSILSAPSASSTPELKDKYLDLLRKMVASLSHNYKDIEIIEKGGMGLIARAFDKERNRKVAIKTILPELKDDNNVVEMFLQECQVIQAMNHPNIVRIFEVGKSDPLYYYVMDFLEGETLQDLIEKKGRLGVSETIKIGAHVSRALQHIHANGLVHRDLKPSNIFITTGGVAKIIDFGVAKLLKSKSTPDFYSSVGSPLYSSPEQLQGDNVSGKSDIYSMGVCLFYMLTGQHPFNSADLLEKMFDTPKNLKDFKYGIPESLIHTIELCINLDPKDRLPAHELWARLRTLQA